MDQWAFQFKLWSTIRDDQICRFTSDSKERFRGNAGVVVTTYNMVAFGGKRSEESEKIIEEIRNREWGLLLMDEVIFELRWVLCYAIRTMNILRHLILQDSYNLNLQSATGFSKLSIFLTCQPLRILCAFISIIMHLPSLIVSDICFYLFRSCRCMWFLRICFGKSLVLLNLTANLGSLVCTRS